MGRAFKSRPKQAADQSSRIPAPFTKAPQTLIPFLERLNPAQVHLTHIDRQSPDHKRKIFAIPVVLNGGIALLLAWRLWTGVPTYWHIFGSLLGHQTATTVDLDATTRNEQFTILFWRTLMFLGDFLLFRFLSPWPLTFFTEQPANPWTWRWRLGFQKEEAVVRVSRGWSNEDLLQGVEQGEENPYFKARVLPAISTAHMRKTGYLLMDRGWDLEFELMLDAHTLAKQGKITLEQLDKMVFVHMENIGWITWQWESTNDLVESRRKQVVAFKDKLTAMGKESLFWKWTEIVEEERDLDGGFTLERQKRVAARVQQEFEKNGVDFDAAIKSIGGLDEAPTT